MTRETYMEKRRNLDNSIMEIEEQLKVVGQVGKLWHLTKK